ncbi:MAG: Rho termination factor N-terminal domain-containing protein, partial [Mycobacterium sp.]|nr:Rho termination factor N-terminal domain-containing protein [Mycobacterium sp.]
MTDTDLITAGSSTESTELPNAETPDAASPAESQASAAENAPAPPTAESSAGTASAAGRGSLSSMVLPELRAVAKEIGVEGASGMRKSELIAAIRERRGESAGRGGG